ncbi:hypothetical protein [Mucilaginibacter psychrotolerans]|uniref:Uncharacterized protein n=1 Tax=Mucilaginibacter psychrotolerans TaxID=1524096 RepID=A0A4Y8SPG4_9SPHI|nr:hypothetical protein [Mucilaginibacter psychrotolerans]TFF40933.1 hypothetical protein E2R66_01795 [Mucilaginibacter psychrotolerans]
MRRPVTLTVLYILCLYDVYLYLPDMLGLFRVDFYPPDPDVLTYFDAAMMLFGGIVLGVFLQKAGGRFNKALCIVMILLNVVLTPWFLYKALP